LCRFLAGPDGDALLHGFALVRLGHANKLTDKPLKLERPLPACHVEQDLIFTEKINLK
jgi:hypothetical protein